MEDIFSHKSFALRRWLDRALLLLMFLAALFAVGATFGILIPLATQTIAFFKLIPVPLVFATKSFLPQSPVMLDGELYPGQFGVWPLLLGTLTITCIALLVAIPLGLLTAVSIAELIPQKLRLFIRPIVEVLAGIPTVVYGFFAVTTVVPFLLHIGSVAHVLISPEAALASGLVMGIMIIPFISSLATDALLAVPAALRNGSYALGATKMEMILGILFPCAFPSLISATLLAFSRAIGETMIVVMAAGLMANFSVNPLRSLTTVTVQIVGALTGDQAFGTAQTLVAFVLGLTLFAATFVINILALYVVRRYARKYE